MGTTTKKRAAGDEPIRGQVRLASYRRVSHGLYVLQRDGLTEDEEFVRELEAYRLVLPKSAVFTHFTGARLRGWRLPKLPEQVPVFVAVRLKDPRPRRHGLICSRLTSDRQPTERFGLPVEEAEEILLRLSRDLGVLDMVIVIDSALRMGDLDPVRMERLLQSRRPGVRMLRIAYRLANPLSESEGETILRIFDEAIDVPVQPQVELFDDRGNLIGRVDLLVTGTTDIHEYDGEHHRDKDQHRVDMRRERGWAGSPYTRSGFALDDLLNHPAVVMHEIDRALDRPHRARRLRRWRAIVKNSLYSEAGRERLMNRWRRQSAIMDWSRAS
ncbi:hypothetical protein [Nocardioides sp.]|uniref:hypothetical protein n=1 Tax=Nocardioides sp. TaxID=35761 RepID=UPI00260180E3|nr:hypothetical protein [Nocardioides sp.]MDI6908354.1 hypothetical protein [Nocardioides sp.]